jgi:tRNA dimethylallyltransferase
MEPEGRSIDREPILALVGPTASGKTALAIELAELFEAEIVNADSRQVYRGLDIGSAKPTVEQQRRVRHHLLDVVEPDEPFDCARFERLAEEAIADIRRRGKRVLVVGGTGLYVRVLRGGLFRGPARHPELRAALETRERARPGTLHAELAAVDPASAARLHPNDRVRLIRALEVYHLTGVPISAWQASHGFREGKEPMVLIGVDPGRTALRERIAARCRQMVEAGLIEEIRSLYERGFSPTLPSLQSLGYREIGAFVRGETDYRTAIERMVQATGRFAKRQRTWFRREPVAHWLLPEWDAVLPVVRQYWS